jgi:germination protein M
MEDVMKRSFISIMIALLIALTACSSHVDNNSYTAAETEKEVVSVVEKEVNEIDELVESIESKPQVNNVPESKGVDENLKAAQKDRLEQQEKNVLDVKKLPKVGEDQTVALTLYYQDREGQLIPVTRKIAKQEGVARAAIAGLIDSAINREEIEFFGLYPVLPKGTEILGITIRNGTAVIDFSKELLNYNSEANERNIISSIIYTLTEFKTIDNVKILVNGYLLDNLKYGTDISGILSRETVMINSDSFKPQKGHGKIDTYLFKSVNDAMTYIIPVSFEISRAELGDIPSSVFESLSGMNAIGELYSQIPSETKLLSSRIEGSTLTLDFDEGILSYGGGTAREKGIIEQILYSAKQIKDVEEVKILINGRTRELPEGYDISRPISIPSVINDIID